MTQARWEASDFDDEQTPPGRPLPTMVSLHFVRSALRRRWLVCALAAVLGLLAATAFLVASPAIAQCEVDAGAGTRPTG